MHPDKAGFLLILSYPNYNESSITLLNAQLSKEGLDDYAEELTYTSKQQSDITSGLIGLILHQNEVSRQRRT